MKNMVLGFWLLVCIFGFALQAEALNMKDEGRPTDIQVELGKVSQVEFPAKVAKVVKGGQPDSVLVEVLDNSVYLLPKSETPSDIFVTTTSGDSYPLNLRLGQNHDIKIQVGSFKNKQTAVVGGYYPDVMDLMKDLLLEREPAGSTVLPSKGQALLSNQQIKLTLEKAYELANWKAYVLNAQNLINNAVIIPLEQISIPNLLAISSQRDMLSSKGQEGDCAKVYLIIGKSNEEIGT